MALGKTAVFLLLFSLYPMAQPSKLSQWKEYTYPSDGFSIAAPASPRIYPDPEAPDIRIFRWELSSDILFVIHSGKRPNCLQVVAKFKEARRKGGSQGTLPGSMKDISLNGYPGVEYESRTVTAHRTFSHLYCVKEKAYDLTLAYPANQVRPELANRFFSSFHLLTSSQ